MFSYEGKMPRTWTAKDDISKVSKAARLAAADVLAQLAVNQVNGTSPAAKDVESAVREMARQDLEESTSGKDHSRQRGNGYAVVGLNAWPSIDEGDVLLSPKDARNRWRQFISDTKMQITQVSLQFRLWNMGRKM